MTALLERVPGWRAKNQEQRLQGILTDRGVTRIEAIPDLNCDGTLEPAGTTFAEGFRMRLRKNVSAVRMRFSIAHEVCHTFFYELVPEMKFRPHEPDDAEERLCNFGAAVLLVPVKALRLSARRLPICLGSLERLSEDYGVSPATMLIRLKSLGLWNCELSNWHRNVGGGFALDGLYGGRRVEWGWQDLSQLERAWESGESVFGTGFVYLEDGRGARRYKPISYNLRRSGAGVLVLWGAGIRKPGRVYPLLEATRYVRKCPGQVRLPP
jgi:hypothetical protein